MKHYFLSLLASCFLAFGLVAWFVEPARRRDWIPMVALGIAIYAVDARLKDMSKRLDKLEPPPSV